MCYEQFIHKSHTGLHTVQGYLENNFHFEVNDIRKELDFIWQLWVEKIEDESCNYYNFNGDRAGA